MSPNAFATGRSPEHAAVAATEGILRLLPENELEGVIAHELSHVKHRDILISTVAATLAAAIMFLANMARFGAIFGAADRPTIARGPNPIALLAMAILAPIAAMLIQMAVSRQREYAADRGGATLVGSPTGLANALRRIDSAAKQIPLEDATPATAHMFIMNPFTRQGLMSPVPDAPADRGADQGADGDAAGAVAAASALPANPQSLRGRPGDRGDLVRVALRRVAAQYSRR